MNADRIKELADEYAYTTYLDKRPSKRAQLHAAIDEMQRELDEARAELAAVRAELNKIEDKAAENNGQDYLVKE